VGINNAYFKISISVNVIAGKLNVIIHLVYEKANYLKSLCLKTLLKKRLNKN
jgi:hypothetical protein